MCRCVLESHWQLVIGKVSLLPSTGPALPCPAPATPLSDPAQAETFHCATELALSADRLNNQLGESVALTHIPYTHTHTHRRTFVRSDARA